MAIEDTDAPTGERDVAASEAPVDIVVEHDEPDPRPQQRDRDVEGFESRRVAKRISKLIGARNAEASARAAAEARAAELERRLAQVQGARLTSEEQRLQVEIDAAHRDLRTARRENDETQEEAAQRRATEAQIALAQIKAHKAQVEAMPVAQPQPNVTPAMQEWMSKNTWFRTDPALTQSALGLDGLARKRGLVPESKEYFAFVDRGMKRLLEEVEEDNANDDDTEIDDDADEGVAVEATPAPKRPIVTAPAAPRRNGPPVTNQTQKTVRLTPEQLEAAKVAGVTPQQYAASFVALRKSGQL